MTLYLVFFCSRTVLKGRNWIWCFCHAAYGIPCYWNVFGWYDCEWNHSKSAINLDNLVNTSHYLCLFSGTLIKIQLQFQARWLTLSMNVWSQGFVWVSTKHVCLMNDVWASILPYTHWLPDGISLYLLSAMVGLV